MERDDLVRDVYAHFGLAMYLAQVLEHGIVNAMVAAQMPSSNSITRQDIDAFMDQQFRNTLGRLLRELQKHIAVPDRLERILSEALSKRNWLAHNYFRERAEDFVTAAGCNRMIVELEGVQQLLTHADHELAMVVRSILERYGATEEAVATEVSKFY